MRNVVKSIFSFSWGMTLLGARTLTRLIDPRDGTGPELDAVAKAAGEELEEPLKSIFLSADRMQSQLIDRLFDAVSGGKKSGADGVPCAENPGSQPLDTSGYGFDASTFVVLGDGLAAGMNHFSLEGSAQSTSFPALLAQGLGTAFKQPLVQAPGLGDVIGMESQIPILPNLRQSTVLHEIPAAADLNNLAVPGMTLADALERRPEVPLVDQRSSLQTSTNFILGLPGLAIGPASGKTQVEYACQRQPTLALVTHGYDEILRSAVAGETSSLPRGGEVGRTLERLLARLLAGPGRPPLTLVTTIPDPLKSAYFSDRNTAARVLKTTPAFLEEHYFVQPDDLVHLPGLYAMGYQMMGRSVGPLSASPVVDSAVASAVRTAVVEANQAIRAAANRAGASVFELHGLLEEIATTGIHASGRHLTTDYLGGLYLLNGVYPGATLNSVIASLMVRWINETFDQSFQAVSIDEVAAKDANTLTELAPGSPSTTEFLRPRTTEEIPDVNPLPDSVQEIPIQTTYPSLQPTKVGCTPAVGFPAAGLSDPSYVAPNAVSGEAPFVPIEIPAEGLELTLEINPVLSYFGDALRPVDCPNDPPLIPGLPPFGLCENTFFGGFLPTTSQLRGKIHLKISPPDENRMTRFEIRHPGGLHGEEGDLSGPQLFRMPVQHTVVRDIDRLVSRGELHLDTGLVTNFHYNVQNMNTALYSLLSLNPGVALPALGAGALTFPGLPNAGSSWIEFTARSDGQLDVSLAGQMFVPFGLEAGNGPVRFALPFTTPDLAAASFVARGTSLHPRIFLTTRPTPSVTEPSKVPQIPFNTVQEFTSFSLRTYFGDAFGLHAEELGDGGSMGRSHLMSRIRVQFGAKTGDTVPLVLQVLPPGGLLNDAPVVPPFLPPGLSRGEIGFDTVMHFPKQTYPQSGLASPDDPFNVCATSIHLASGEMVSPLLWRGYVVQALFANLIQVEPCTPADSFNYQGPARFERDAHGQLVLRWNGTVFLPYPKGFKFPSPNPGGEPAYTIQADSRLDPFRSVQAMRPRGESFSGVFRGGAEDAQSPATEQRFSYRFAIPGDPERAAESLFEYTNHTQGGTFRLTALSWVQFTHARNSAASLPDVVTFSGFGTWSGDSSGALHQVSVQISDAEGGQFVGIQVDGGATSNVDLKPPEVEPA